MVKVELNPKTNKWDVLEKGSPKGLYLDGLLKEKLDSIQKLVNKGWDAVFVIDGKERSGKSTLGMTCAWYLSKKKLTIKNFARGLQDAKRKVRDLPDNSVLFLDEGSLVFNSKDSIRRENVELLKIMDVVGQKNMIFIIVLPSFFDLSKQIATRRSLFLLHVGVDDEWQRGYFEYYGLEEKAELYEVGKKKFGKYDVSAEFNGMFTKFELPFNDDYLKLKRQTLDIALNGGKEDELKKEIWSWKYKIFKLMKSCPIKTQKQVAKVIGKSTQGIDKWEEYGDVSI